MHIDLTLARLRRPGPRAWLGLLALVLTMQGVGQGIARIATPSHGHRSLLQATTGAAPEHDHVAPRDGHRSIPWIAVQPEPTHAHAALGSAAHAHAFDDASVVYLDADGDAADAAPAVVALAPPPGSTVLHAAPEGHAAWSGAPGWHALVRTTAPPHRPPRPALIA